MFWTSSCQDLQHSQNVSLLKIQNLFFSKFWDFFKFLKKIFWWKFRKFDMVGRVAVTGQYLMTDFKKQANIQMSPNDEGYVFNALSYWISVSQERHLAETNNNSCDIFWTGKNQFLPFQVCISLRPFRKDRLKDCDLLFNSNFEINVRCENYIFIHYKISFQFLNCNIVTLKFEFLKVGLRHTLIN